MNSNDIVGVVGHDSVRKILLSYMDMNSIHIIRVNLSILAITNCSIEKGASFNIYVMEFEKNNPIN